MCDSNVSHLIYGYEFNYKGTLQEMQMLFPLICIISDAYNFRITAYPAMKYSFINVILTVSKFVTLQIHLQ